MGMHPAINEATKLLLKKGPICSASLLATGPAFEHATDCLLEAGIQKVGVHLSLTSEYSDLEQRPVCNASQVPSLVTAKGTFYRSIKEIREKVRYEEVLLEWHAQILKIQKARFGLTHIDGHMFCYEPELTHRPDLLDVIVQLSNELKIPYREIQSKRSHHPERCIQKWATPSAFADYEKILRGEFSETFIELIIHPSIDDSDLLIRTQNAEYRFQDFQFFSSKKIDLTTVEILGWSDVRREP